MKGQTIVAKVDLSGGKRPDLEVRTPSVGPQP
jgi:hypothetical protein